MASSGDFEVKEVSEAFFEEIETKNQPLRLFVPGRVCLFGEHSDWAGGYRRFNSEIVPGRCIVSGTNQGLYAKIYQHPSNLIVRSVDQNGKTLGTFESAMDVNTLREIAAEGGLFSYAAGVAYQILLRYNVGGLIIDNYLTTLPIKKGLSSSAAVCVLAARAFNRVYNLKLTIQGEMDLAYMGEISTPSRCGRMDQCCAFGNRPVLMTFDGDRCDCEEIPVGAELHLVLVDLCAAKDTKIILGDLNTPFPYPQDEAGKELQNLLGPINKEITARAIDAIKKGDTFQVGALMTEAASEFDRCAIPICPSQLTAPVLHKVMNWESLKPHMFGCKGVGAGGDGTCQILAKTAEDQEIISKIIIEELNMQPLQLTIGKSKEIRRAIIPTASYSPEMFPATKSISNALFPVVDEDGIAKPFISILVEEALDAGLSEVIVIVSPHDENAFRGLFEVNLPKSRFQKLSPAQQRYAKKLIEMSKSVKFVIQEHQEGLGHAIFQAKDFIQNEPFLLMLGDHLYKTSISGHSCVKQILDSYSGENLVGLKLVDEEEVQRYGIVQGKWKDVDRKYIALTELVEKPQKIYAKQNLSIVGLPENQHLAFFGLYCLDGAAVMNILKDDITSNNRSENGGFGLTSVLERIRRENSVSGYMIEGTCLDIGNPSAYIRTLQEFAQVASN